MMFLCCESLLYLHFWQLKLWSCVLVAFTALAVPLNKNVIIVLVVKDSFDFHSYASSCVNIVECGFCSDEFRSLITYVADRSYDSVYNIFYVSFK